jgi:hypothetical protein
MDFVALVDQLIALLRQRGRVTYRLLKRQFQLDDEVLEDLKEELVYGQQVAVDEEGRVLVWTGTAASPSTPAPHPAEPVPQLAVQETPPPRATSPSTTPYPPDTERRRSR